MPFIRCTLLLTFWWLFGSVENAMALQTHGAPEGLYVHQMAHLLFIGALAYLYWHTRRTQETSGKGWKYFQLFCLFLIAWNALAFTGHSTYEHLEAGDFIDQNTWAAKLAYPITFKKILFYLAKMDHFLIVPALFALVISLRSFYLQAKRGIEK
jgi:hypothetical protein